LGRVGGDLILPKVIVGWFGQAYLRLRKEPTETGSLPEKVDLIISDKGKVLPYYLTTENIDNRNKKVIAY